MFYSRIFLITVFLTGFSLAGQPAEAVKPMAPLEVSLELGGTPQVGGEVSVLVRVRSMVDAPWIRVRCILPKGVEMVSSQDTWEGELVAGSMKEVTFILKVKAPGQHLVRAMANIKSSEGFQMVRGASLLIDLSDEAIGLDQEQEKAKNKAKNKKRFIIRKGKDGRVITEIPTE